MVYKVKRRTLGVLLCETLSKNYSVFPAVLIKYDGPSSATSLSDVLLSVPDVQSISSSKSVHNIEGWVECFDKNSGW